MRDKYERGSQKLSKLRDVMSSYLNCSLTCLMMGNISSNFPEKKSMLSGDAPAPPSPPIIFVTPDRSGANWFFSRNNLVKPEKVKSQGVVSHKL